METTGRITQEIIERIREQKTGGLDAFVRQLGSRLLLFTHYRIGEKLRARVDPDDVLQDIYAAIVENREGFLDKVDRRGVHRAIYRMIDNRIRDLYEHHYLVEKRNAGREVAPARDTSQGGAPLDQVASTDDSITRRIAVQDEYRSLIGILELLPATAQQLFVMKFVQELTNQEIADELKVSVSTLKRDVADLVRTIQRLRSARSRPSLPSGR